MTRWWALAVGASCALTACGKASSIASSDVATTPRTGDDTRTGKDTPAECERVHVLVVGTKPGDVTSLSLKLDALEASLAGTGAPLAVHAERLGSPLPLCDGNPVEIGTFDLPKEGGDVLLRLWLAGGTAHKGDREGDLDRCGGPLTFEFERARLVRGVCHVVLELNLGRSVARDGDGLAFLPHLRVVFF